MDISSASILSSPPNFSLQFLVAAAIISLISVFLSLRFFKPSQTPATTVDSDSDSICGGANMGISTSDSTKCMNASMMEQLVPDITSHVLSYLDYPSLCRLSMTNSLMRQAANNDNVWRALYRKDFTLGRQSVTPANGWKAYYASTKAVVNVNAVFINIINDQSLPDMRRFWLNDDYVKCIHSTGEVSSGYVGVMQSWEVEFNRGLEVNFQVRDVQVRVLADTAWVTMTTFDFDSYNMTNVYESHNGNWYMVHHHTSVAN